MSAHFSGGRGGLIVNGVSLTALVIGTGLSLTVAGGIGTIAIAPTIADYVRITTTGATLDVELALVAGSPASIRAVCEETAQEALGTSISLAFGSVANRHVRIYVEDGGISTLEDLHTINLGFSNADDTGNQALGVAYDHPPQAISAIEYTENLSGLEIFCAANTQLAGTLDLSASVNLRHLECFGASVSNPLLPTTVNALRVCLEGNNLQQPLDLNPVAATLYDFRCAIQQSGGLTLAPLVGATTLANCYHFCVRGETAGYYVANLPTQAQFPVIEELLVWNTSQNSALTIVSTICERLEASDNLWSSVDLSAAPLLNFIDLDTCGLTSAEVDALCIEIESWSTSNGTLDLLGNDGPTVASGAARAALAARGWILTIPAEVGVGVNADTFDRADSAVVGNGWFDVDVGFGANVDAEIVSNALVRNDDGATYHYQAYLNPGATALPADYIVSATVPHATTLAGVIGLIGRWTAGNGVRVLLIPDRNTVTCGSASSYDGGAVAFTTTNGFPASWSIAQDHTIALVMAGTACSFVVDGQEVGTFTSAVNASAIGTAYGICGEGNGYSWLQIGTNV